MKKCKHKKFITRIISVDAYDYDLATKGVVEFIQFICLDDGIIFREQRIENQANNG